ncbi:hypothetical protein FACS189468_3620 [Spirochaetia bacterium]|nr:hypothetical protein FACS189468_3620 [Spirochaetia bacterium]
MGLGGAEKIHIRREHVGAGKILGGPPDKHPEPLFFYECGGDQVCRITSEISTIGNNEHIFSRVHGFSLCFKAGYVKIAQCLINNLTEKGVCLIIKF